MLSLKYKALITIFVAYLTLDCANGNIIIVLNSFITLTVHFSPTYYPAQFLMLEFLKVGYKLFAVQL